MNLLDYKHDKYSSTGNDGIVEKIFQILDINDGLFVEFGAWDGVKGSNCRKLFEEGWSGIFIEPQQDRFLTLKKNYLDHDNIICLSDAINNTNSKFDDVIRQHIDRDIDFCSIDIDGLDLEVFETFSEFMPKVVCIEGGQMVEPFCHRLPNDISSHNIQQGLKVIASSFEEKGYKLLCSYQDCFFVKDEYFHLFDVSEDIMEHYLNGLHALHRRLPWIQYTIRGFNISNKIIDYVLQKSDYRSYGYNNRKVWAKEKEKEALEAIEFLRTKYEEQRRRDLEVKKEREMEK
jgi:hypothetical protein